MLKHLFNRLGRYYVNTPILDKDDNVVGVIFSNELLDGKSITYINKLIEKRRAKYLEVPDKHRALIREYGYDYWLKHYVR